MPFGGACVEQPGPWIKFSGTESMNPNGKQMYPGVGIAMVLGAESHVSID